MIDRELTDGEMADLLVTCRDSMDREYADQVEALINEVIHHRHAVRTALEMIEKSLESSNPRPYCIHAVPRDVCPDCNELVL